MDKNHCWTALKYTILLQFITTPALKDSEGNIAVSIKAKKALVWKSAFLKSSPNFFKTPAIPLGLAHAKIIEKTVGQILLTQVSTKAPGPNKINFQVLQMIWS